MFRPEEAEARELEREATSDRSAADSMSRLRSTPLVSDVRALLHDGVGSNARDLPGGMTPPPLDLLRMVEHVGVGDELPGELSTALRSGDVISAVTWLLKQNRALHEQLQSAREDFDELRAVNVGLEEQLTVDLAKADDLRLNLAEELDRTKDEVLALERLVDEANARLSSEVELARQTREVLEEEIASLRR
jgi:hypothetical protein